MDKQWNPPDFVHLFIRQFLTDFEDGLSVLIRVKGAKGGQNENRALLLQHSCRSRDLLIGRLGFKHGWTINPGQGMTSWWVGKNTFALVSYFTTLNYSRSWLLRCGKIGRAPLRRWKL